MAILSRIGLKLLLEALLDRTKIIVVFEVILVLYHGLRLGDLPLLRSLRSGALARSSLLGRASLAAATFLGEGIAVTGLAELLDVLTVTELVSDSDEVTERDGRVC